MRNSDAEMLQIARDGLTKSKTDSKYNIKEEKMTVDTLISEPKYTKEFINSWHRHLPYVRKLLFDVKESVRSVVMWRNQLLKNLKLLHTYLSDSYDTYTKYDFAELAKISTKAHCEKLMDPVDLWGLKQKCETKEVAEMDEDEYSDC